MTMNLQDASMGVSKALPAASGTAHTNGIDLEVNAEVYTGTPQSDFLAGCEFLFTVPALGTTPLPDADTMTYSIEEAVDSAFTSPDTLFTLGTQTGAGGAGAAAFSRRFRLPTNVKRFVRGTAVSSSGTAATATSMTLQPVF